MSDRPSPGLGCARCGNCCESIYMSAEMDLIRQAWTTEKLDGVPDPGMDEGWKFWLEHGWTDDRRPTAIAKYSPAHPDQSTANFTAEHWHLVRSEEDHQIYDCDMFDTETRLCTAGEGRPPVCSGYPWYGEEPGRGRAVLLGPQCSYLLDVAPADRPENARPLIPIEVV